MSAARVWRAPVPAGILVLAAAVAIGGSAAGFLAAMPLLFLTSPVFAAGLAGVAVLQRRAPEWSLIASDTLERLPAGEGRRLLLDLLRRAAAVPADAHASPLVAAACDAARQLSALEIHLAAFEAQRDVVRDPSPRWRDALERCRRGRDLLTVRLQDASAALSRWQAAQGAGESLGKLARELSDESRYQHDAAREVEALLS